MMHGPINIRLMKRLAFVGERHCVFCEVQMEILNGIWIKLTFEIRGDWCTACCIDWMAIGD